MILRTWLIIMVGAAMALGETKPPETLQQCRNILEVDVHDRNPDTRKAAAEALSLVGVKDGAVNYLAPMLDDRDVAVRIAAITSLGDFKDDRTIPLLKKALSDPVPEVDFTAGKVLYQLHDPSGEQFLMEVVGKESKASSGYITKEKRNALRMLHTPTKLFTFVAIQAAGFAPVPGLGFGLSSAQGILLNPDSSARAASLLLIGNSSDKTLPEEVELVTADKEWSLRAAAVHVIAMHPFPQLRQSLVPLLEDKKEEVRVRAAAAYMRLEPAAKPLPAKPAAKTKK